MVRVTSAVVALGAVCLAASEQVFGFKSGPSAPHIPPGLSHGFPPAYSSNKTDKPTQYFMAGPQLTGYAAASAVNKVPVIPISGDGIHCPSNTEPSAKSSDGYQCTYGNAEGTIHVHSGLSKCCYSPQESVFLLSTTGETYHAANYFFDSKFCCVDEGEVDASLTDGMCVYGQSRLTVPTSYVTKCCWNKKTDSFGVHLRQSVPNIPHVVINKGTKVDIFPDLSAGATVVDADIYQSFMALKIMLWLGGAINEHITFTIQVWYSHKWEIARRWQFGTWIPGEVYADFETLIRPDLSIDYKVHYTGSGIFGRLEETTGPFHIDTPPELKLFLGNLKMC
ncbi:hypothetical protein CPC735_060580 [Coccidioides posadasii C735 delta SOWgp]|nr:hypothetical protein CPC735_060580 [Coccidioides posadasii C735 delta SOWgp]EER24688.1 hypothetical protein CPC735_060580 [Coccidioides posadasii C735 delta SOWgp]KMM66509.1 hypothetical protein CPAG_02848 [Coccidioides posadasii RMSCC 3488]|eukprot:XP_003066833.1 hypothetical protein CPC735_060580 [Coccidioides posadasii C735 delta SOWgp]